MQVISNNPYRVLGILAGATAREIIRQANTIKKFITAGQDPPCDYCFTAFGKLNRSIESVDIAVAKLNLDSDRMTAALFWFFKGSLISDEPAFEALKAGDINTALQIWDKLIFVETKEKDKKEWNPVSGRNYSAFHNYFVGSLLNANNDSKNLSNAVAAQLKFLESDYCSMFVAKITDYTFKATSKELQHLFLNEMVREAEQKTINITLGQLISVLDNNSPVKQNLVKNISQKLTEKITAEIEIAQKSAEDKEQAAKRGDALFKQTKDDLEQLKIILGEQDFTYYNTADKLANEILQCGIDHFEYFKNTGINHCRHSMVLLDLANDLAVGNRTKQSCQNHRLTIQQWIKKKGKKKNLFQRYYRKFLKKTHY